MPPIGTIITIVVCVLLLYLLLKIIRLPIKLLFKLLLNMLSGLVLLFVFNFIGGFFDFSLGINATNALVAGVLVAWFSGNLFLVAASGCVVVFLVELLL